ncbi:MAG: hypothetical protein JXQ96_09200 [Cyclobacteriaceae bacterium]
MNTKAKIIISIQTVFIVFFIVFASIRAKEAESQVINSEKRTKEFRINAERMATEAERAAALAREAENTAFEAMKKLEECQAK